MTSHNEILKYRDSDNVQRELKECVLTVDKNGKHWLWSEKLEQNLAYKINNREDVLLASIASLLFIIELKDERIKSLQHIADLATIFADQIKPDCNEDQDFLSSYR